MFLIATQDGVYRWNGADRVERVLDSGESLGVYRTKRGAFVTSKSGLYRSVDGGDGWDRVRTPQSEVFAFAASPDASRLYVGTHPAHMYVSTDGGDTWNELEGFNALPSRSQWHTPRHRGRSHVRSIGVHPDEPGRVVAGVEVGGIHVSDDYGNSWDERRADLHSVRTDDLQFDVHHVLVRRPDEFIISCGGGLFRTNDGGRQWTQLRVDPAREYFHSSHVHDGTLYTASQSLPPELPFGSKFRTSEVDARAFISTDHGETFEEMSYPGAPEEFVYCWASAEGKVYAGTTGGTILVRNDQSWTVAGRVPQWIRSLTYLQT